MPRVVSLRFPGLVGLACITELYTLSPTIAIRGSTFLPVTPELCLLFSLAGTIDEVVKSGLPETAPTVHDEL